VFQKTIDEAKQQKIQREFIPKAHHILMKTYGWISLEEFKQLPIPTLFSLLDMIHEDNKNERNASRR